MTLYKVLNKNLKCLCMQYKLDEWNCAEGPLVLCKNGLHCCEVLTECFSYGYSFPSFGNRHSISFPTRVFVVECGDEYIKSSDETETKRCCRMLKLVRELDIKEILATVMSEIKSSKAFPFDIEMLLIACREPKLYLRLTEELIASPGEFGRLDAFFFVGQMQKGIIENDCRTIFDNENKKTIIGSMKKLSKVVDPNTRIMLGKIIKHIEGE